MSRSRCLSGRFRSDPGERAAHATTGGSLLAVITLRRLVRRTLPLFGLVLVASACTDAAPGPTTTPGLATTPSVATLPPLTTAAATTTTPTTTTTTVSSTTSDAAGGGIFGEIEDLMAAVEDVRALGFLVPPEIVVLSPSEFANRVGLLMEEREDELRNDAMTLLFRLIGMLEAGDDLETLRRDLSGLPEIAWYDPGTASLLVADRPSGLGPLARSELFHEMVHALADQHYRWSDARAALLGAGADDRLAAFDALVEGDATYFQVVYIQQLPAGEREAIAREFVEQSPGSAEAPAWLLNDLAFPFDAGFDFVADLVAGGGIAAVDRAYLDPPTTSEHIVHPERFRRGETARVVGPPAASIDGYANLPAATFGEWGMRLLLEGSLSAGMLTQTVDGWGGDSYQLFITGGGEVAFGLVYLGDAEFHTVEVTQAFIDFAEDVLRLGDGVRTGGREVFERNNRPWMFLDREGEGLVVVIASDPDAGAELAAQLSPP